MRRVGVGCGGRVEELRARKEKLAVEFEHFVEFGGYVAADYVFDAYSGRLEFAGLFRVLICCLMSFGDRWRGGALGGQGRVETYLEQLCHFPSLLFRLCRVLLLYHAQAGYGELELHLELVLGWWLADNAGW